MNEREAFEDWWSSEATPEWPLRMRSAAWSVWQAARKDLLKDAERYRYFRENSDQHDFRRDWGTWIDDEIDRSISKEQGK